MPCRGWASAVRSTMCSSARDSPASANPSLSGEVHASAVTAAFEDQRLPRDAILDRLSGPGDTPVLGAATTMTGAYAADLPTRKGPQLAPVEVRMYQPHLLGLWGQGFGDWGTTSSDNNAAKLSRDTGGFIIGADTTIGTGWSGVWRLGVAGGYTDDSLKVSGRLSSGDYQSMFGAVYGGTNYGAFDLKLGAIAASSDTHTNRTISFPMFSGTASSIYGGYAALHAAHPDRLALCLWRCAPLRVAELRRRLRLLHGRRRPGRPQRLRERDQSRLRRGARLSRSAFLTPANSATAPPTMPSKAMSM